MIQNGPVNGQRRTVIDTIRDAWARLDTDVSIVSIIDDGTAIHVGISHDSDTDGIERALSILAGGIPVSVVYVPAALLPLINGDSGRSRTIDDPLAHLNNPELERITAALRKVDAVRGCRAVNYGHLDSSVLHVGIVGRTDGFDSADERRVAGLLGVDTVKLIHVHAHDNRGYLPKSPNLVVGQWIRGARR